MARSSRIVLLGALAGSGLVVAYYTAWIVSFSRKLKPLVECPAARIVAGSYALDPVSSERTIDIGYATFSLPTGVAGEAVRVGSTSIICIVSEPGGLPSDAVITIFPPLFEQDGWARRLSADYVKLAGTPLKNRFEFDVAALSAQPFTMWEALRQGKRESARRAVLLAVKDLEFGSAEKVAFGLSGRIGFIVAEMPQHRGTLVTLEDLERGVSQTFYVKFGRNDVRAIVSSLVHSYRPNPSTLANEAVGRQIDALGLRTADL